ncbi:PepSY-associated TM helix domain-containing protein [Pseudomonas sp. OTU2001]|uniref:PepSY-associated TM helix domain-containing protein n=1 Tax=Pseudomonas sp. OTU2001 TaxID=3043859 RepID=UPI00313DA696
MGCKAAPDATEQRQGAHDDQSPRLAADPLPQLCRTVPGLHFAQFGGYPMRWLYFVCGLVSCLMIASGLVLFCVKRGRKYASAEAAARRWYRVAEVCNVGFVSGLLLACVGLLWASRVLPVELAQRESWEVRAFFGVWLLALLHAGIRPVRRAWIEQLLLTALLCIGLGALGGLGDAMRLGVAACALVLGVLLGLLVWRLWQAQWGTQKARSGRCMEAGA